MDLNLLITSLPKSISDHEINLIGFQVFRY
jgi:hypothetical protein